MAISKEFIPHTELKASDLNELIAQVNAYIAEINATLEAAIASSTSGIERQAAQSEEQAIIFETDGGVPVGQIDSTGADFTNLKRGGQQVARMSDLPTKDSSIGENPSTTNVPTTKAVKDYVDAHSGDYPIDKESTLSEAEEQVWGNDAETQEYAKIGSYGMKSKAYLDMQGDSIIDGEIGDTPSASHAPSSKAVKDYVDEHGGGTGDLPIEKTAISSPEEYVVIRNSADTEDVFKVTDEGVRVKSLKDMQGNPMGGISVGVQTISGKKYLVFS